MGIITVLKEKISMLKQNVLTVFFAAVDKRTPIYLRLLSLISILYALIPIDIFSDFVPFIGLLDDLFLVTLGFGLVLQKIPSDVQESARLRADRLLKKAAGCATAIFIMIIIWLLILWFGVSWLIK
ncbi:MAG: DUF1232 domain-containing protein [Nitrospirae bacterium]|nr:DUF1232 domain-containing protein [Nitrospirota bacterium]